MHREGGSGAGKSRETEVDATMGPVFLEKEKQAGQHLTHQETDASPGIWGPHRSPVPTLHTPGNHSALGLRKLLVPAPRAIVRKGGAKRSEHPSRTSTRRGGLGRGGAGQGGRPLNLGSSPPLRLLASIKFPATGPPGPRRAPVLGSS